MHYYRELTDSEYAELRRSLWMMSNEQRRAAKASWPDWQRMAFQKRESERRMAASDERRLGA